MKTKDIIKSGMEIIDNAQLYKIKGGKTIYIIIGNQRVPIEVPD